MIDHRKCIDGSLIGLTGCGEHKYYLNTLPGIDVAAIADHTNTEDLRPEEVVRKSCELAIDSVMRDIVLHMTKDFKYNPVVDRTNINNIGVYEWFGLENVELGFKMNYMGRVMNESLMTTTGFEILVDRDVDGIEIFYECEADTKSFLVDIKKGRNFIEMPFWVAADVFIYFNVSNFKVGRSQFVDTIYKRETPCIPCVIGSCHYVELLKKTGDQITFFDWGLKVEVSCVHDFCSFVSKHVDQLSHALIYQTGIQYLVYAKSTSRVNSYTRNSENKIDFLLLRWQGGRDEATGLSYSGDYWKALKSAFQTLQNYFMREDLYFNTTKTKVINSLP